MAQTTASKNLSGRTSNVLDLFEKLPEQLQVKIIGAGIFAMSKNFKQEEKTELFRFLCSYRDNK